MAVLTTSGPLGGSGHSSPVLRNGLALPIWSLEPSGSSLVMLVPLGFSLIQEKIIDLLSC